MKLGEFMDGLAILRPYYNGGDGHHISAEHDVFYAYATDKPVSPDDVSKLFALGWFQKGVKQPREGNAQYDPDEGWAAYT